MVLFYFTNQKLEVEKLPHSSLVTTIYNNIAKTTDSKSYLPKQKFLKLIDCTHYFKPVPVTTSNSYYLKAAIIILSL